MTGTRDTANAGDDWLDGLEARRWRVEASGIWRSEGWTKRELNAPTRWPRAASDALQRFSQSTTDDGNRRRPTTRLPESGCIKCVTNLARRRLERLRGVRWPPKDGQPRPTLKRARLSHWLQASRPRHCAAGNGRRGMNWAFNSHCLTFDMSGSWRLADNCPLDGGVRPLRCLALNPKHPSTPQGHSWCTALIQTPTTLHSNGRGCLFRLLLGSVALAPRA
jgi:hypothetical protein